MTEHTPGPWAVDSNNRVIGPPRPHKQGATIGLDTGVHLASVKDTICYVTCLTLAAQPANARLIAAAPDLLAALEQLVTDWQDVPDPMDRESQGPFEQARAAIAKARGRL